MRQKILQNTIIKLLIANIITEEENIIPLTEDQQGFRKKTSTIDAIFIIRQLEVKSVELNYSLFLCFINLIKTFVRLRKKRLL